MAKRIQRFKDRFLSKIRWPFHYKKVNKNRDGLDESMINSGECGQTQCETPQKTIANNCLKADNNSPNNNSDSPSEKGPAFSELEGSNKSRISVVSEEKEEQQQQEQEQEEELEEEQREELTNMKLLPSQTRRRSSAFQRLINWVKPEKRRFAICEQMEREIETRGVSLRQYRKFLATTYILYDLKML